MKKIKDISIALFLEKLNKEVKEKFGVKKVNSYYEFGSIGSKEDVIKIIIEK